MNDTANSAGTVATVNLTPSDAFCDKNIAQNYGKLTTFNLAPVGGMFAEYRWWLHRYQLTVHLNVPVKVPDETLAASSMLLRRGVIIVDDFDDGCLALTAFVSGNKNDRTSNYLRALRRFESVVSLLHATCMVLAQPANGPKLDLYKTADGPFLKRLGHITNRAKHADPRTLPYGYIVPVWLQNEGIFTTEDAKKKDQPDIVSVGYDELREAVRKFAAFCDAVARCMISKEFVEGLDRKSDVQ